MSTTIGARIKARRQELKMTQRELAARLGNTDHTTVTRIESGKTDPPQSRVAQFAKVLDVTPGYLMGWDEKPAEELQDMGALAAQLVMDLDAMEMMREYLRLGESDRHTVRVLVTTLVEKIKKTDAVASVVKTKKSLKKADCDI